MTNADFSALPPREKQHFMRCPECGEWFDKRDLDAVFFHCTDHVQRPDIPYGGCSWPGKEGEP